MVSDEFEASRQKIEQFDPGRVYAGIAMAALNPSHSLAYKTSCYAHVAAAMREGRVQDDDLICLAGKGGNSHHAFVVRDGTVVVDSLRRAGGRFDFEKEKYFDAGTKIGDEGFDLITAISFAEFKARYNAKTLAFVAQGTTYPDPADNIQ